MALHRRAVGFLARLRADGVRPDHELTVAQLRARADLAPVGPVEPVVDSYDLLITGPGHPVPVRVYAPATSPVGVVVYLYDGGHFTGTLDSYDVLARRLANRIPATVVAVDYRRAPEHRYPAPVEDAFTTYRWTLDHAANLASGDLGRGSRVVVAGDSAGGNNTAVLARWIRETGGRLAAALALQVLIYPTLDAVGYRAGTGRASYTDCALLDALAPVLA